MWRSEFLVGSMVLLISIWTMLWPKAEEGRALIVIDMQNCFSDQGSMAVEGTNDIVPLINQITELHKFDLVVR